MVGAHGMFVLSFFLSLTDHTFENDSFSSKLLDFNSSNPRLNFECSNPSNHFLGHTTVLVEVWRALSAVEWRQMA